MRPQGDTNPHFIRPYQNQDQLYPQPSGPEQQYQNPHFGRQYQNQDQLPPQPSGGQQQHVEPPPVTRPRRTKNQGRHSQPPVTGVLFKSPNENEQDPLHPRSKQQGQHPKPPSPIVPYIPHHDHDQHPQQGHPRHPGQSPHPQSLHIPHPQETSLFAWSTAIFCAIFWVFIIIAGLVVLIVYLVFRPRTPKFDITAATLNAAYLDMGYLLNADLTLLANFTNPNKKVSVDFSYMIIDLYYGNTHIATQYIEPFSAQKRKSMFANIHMVASQVRLGMLESQRLKRQLETNRAQFEVKGYFRARSNFGSVLRYSYWMHGDCKVVFSRPPDGVLVGRKCRTKH